MKSRVTERFLKRYQALPAEVRKTAKEAYQLWAANPHHQSLRFKRVSQKAPLYSIRIGLRWRAVGMLEDDTIYWFWIGSHAEYDGLLSRL